MAEVEIYTIPTCPYCHLAKALLTGKDIPFTEIDVATEPDLREKMSERANGATKVPQVFIGGKHVGGCDDLHDLDLSGELDSLLGLKEAP